MQAWLAVRTMAYGLFTMWLAGCSQEKACPELGTCGGPVPQGGWGLGTGHASCSEDLQGRVPDQRLVGGDVPAARMPPLEEASPDWCSGLIAAANDILYNAPLIYVESAAIGVASIAYNADLTYAVGLTQTGTYLLNFSPTCVRQFGAVDGAVGLCEQVRVEISDLLETKARMEQKPPPYRNITCLPDNSGGCGCYFDVAEQKVLRGVYAQVGSNEILHTPNPADFPSRATFCNQSGSLQLTGADGSYLFNQPGLRTLDLGPVNCTDGVQGLGEEGVDCGVACNLPCPTCYDRMQNQGEEGEDCGAVCNRACAP